MVTPRTHVVLIPGFVGFDAFGQLEYYAGVTRLFEAWQSEHPELAAVQAVVLHYFDNLPTASVATRAERLRRFLTVRMERGHIKAKDKIVLIGHSTGGLDIRHMVRSLTDPSYRLGSVTRAQVEAWATLRTQIKRVVFMSVPHRGTNIADWVQDHPSLVRTLLDFARAAVETKDLPAVGEVLAAIVPAAVKLELELPGSIDFVLAAEDAINESNDRAPFATDPVLAAQAREAQGDLEVWLKQMADFGAISDLAVTPGVVSGLKSPAHFDAEELAAEQQDWSNPPIDVSSFVTRSPSPFDADLLPKNDRWKLAWLPSYPCFHRDDRLVAKTDFIYWSAYRACCAGPFQISAALPRLYTLDGDVSPDELEAWDNDAIANSASMPWPSGNNYLVLADHADIIGHHTRVASAVGAHPPPEVRRFRAYDFFHSASGFSHSEFDKVWRNIFSFAAS